MATVTIWLAGALLLWLPGAAAGRLLLCERDPFVRLAMQFAIGIAFWPLLLLWTSAAGWHWSPIGVRIVVAVLGTAALLQLRRGRVRGRFAMTYALLFAADVVSRVLQSRELVFPAWVDSVHHAMIIRLLLVHGRIPATLDPWIPNGQFYYHWGYHALVAFVSWLLGFTTPARLPMVMLAFGQLLNALTFVMVYAGGRVLFRSRQAGLAAATFATTASMFPAFYVSWGRYTQLTGLLLLPPLLIALWRLAARPRFRELLLAAVLASGLVLIHVRVAFFAAIAAAVLWAAAWMSGRRTFIVAWTGAAAAAAALSAPWLVHLLTNRHVAQFVRPAALRAGSIEAALPLTDVIVRGDPLPWIAIASAVLLMLTMVVRKRGVPWSPMIFIGAVTAAVAAALQIRLAGVVFARLASNASAEIALFLPLALAAGGALAAAARCLLPRRAVPVAITAVLLASSAAGLVVLRDIVVPQTVLADADDAAAMQWIRGQTPVDARFAVNARRWMGDVFMGTDGGYWIPLMTGRAAIVPPALYAWTLPADKVAAINRVIEAWSDRFALADPTIDYIYTNRTRDGGRWKTIAALPSTRLVYARGAVRIFSMAPEERRDRSVRPRAVRGIESEWLENQAPPRR